MPSRASSFRPSRRPKEGAYQGQPPGLSGQLAVILRRALDPSAGDSVFNRRIRSLYQRLAAGPEAQVVNQDDFIHLVAAWLRERPRRSDPVGQQDSCVLGDTVSDWDRLTSSGTGEVHGA